MGPETDPKVEATEQKVVPRLKQMLGEAPFRLDWMSVYKFRCARLEKFVHDRVVFVGDSAHVVSPFGARGGNGGVQDVDNLGWKLAAVVHGDARPSLIETYNIERGHGADENMRHSARATNFMTPKSPIEALFRDQVLTLASEHPFARKLINSGRLSQPCSLAHSPLQTAGDAPLRPGSALIDAPLIGARGDSWLLREVQGQFTLLAVGEIAAPEVPGLDRIGIGQSHDRYRCFNDHQGHAQRRYGSGFLYLLRPDGHVCAVFDQPDSAAIARAFDRAKGAAA